MPSRRKPISTKQRKAELQLKRAIKRGDVSPPPPQSAKSRGKKRRIPIGSGGAAQDPAVAALAANRIESSRKLQSAFLRLSPSFLALAKQIASTVPLPRPIPDSARYLPEAISSPRSALTCPKRPKWRYDMEKKEVEKNEEAVFKVWERDVSEKIEAWRKGGEEDSAGTEAGAQSESAPRSPTYYERNLEVWRQLWRVTEISSILLVLLDARCPPIHYPPSLHSYLTSLVPTRKIILILTKTDIVGDECAAGWKAWLEERYPSVTVVPVESYRLKPGNEERKGQGARVQREPHIPPPALDALLAALKKAHEELLRPPPNVQADPAKLANWKPRVREVVGWAEAGLGAAVPVVMNSHSKKEETESPMQGQESSGGDKENEGETPPNEPSPTEALTIGLIGQPNVGKSSLLNALFGTNKVKASRTPGKTKHFQTLYWTPTIRLVDCPGLVLPSYVQMELQVLASTLAISQMPSIPSCVHFISKHIPLERVFGLAHPSLSAPAVEDKRTWREGQKRTTSTLAPGKEGEIEWTAVDIMTAYADKKGWVTAKAGRPDVNRAGNAILRMVAEGKVRWAFWPPTPAPETDTGNAARESTDGNGIWIPEEAGHNIDEDDEEDDEEEDEDEGSAMADSDRRSHTDMGDGVEDDDEDDGDDESGEGRAVKVATTSGRFAALGVGDDGDDEESEDEDES
ncbi:hypothetical protein BOTBODRAFT_32560 [Botryobasidium botryosum FD-172 SS1]|uniref:Guanine nucleotide-binding protein-like 1 n=1 Tax=Botryobasidium botryosum (strain FD-172 SS1) TaxID=930990 RepID=A0A067MS88_BOTB1|nr:hypothetical protein BOTBODRAFT_32560 [Botryobasidium botryosum FD-172 SS1]